MPFVKNTKAPQKPKNAKKTIIRTLSLVADKKLQLTAVFICIIISSIASVASAYFIRPMIDDYIAPFIGQKNPDLSGFTDMLLLLGAIMLLGVITSYIYRRIMVNVTNATLLKVRHMMFDHMQTLPISFFDRRIHGDTMSCYTNDTDALRQMISQALPQFVTCILTVITVFVIMIITSPLLTLIVIAALVLILFIIKMIGKKSGYYFRRQQDDLAKVNGYIEEIIGGQKVVKVFCHEEETLDEFSKINEDLRISASNAHTYANILGPIMNNLSYIQYAVTAIAGAVLIVTGHFGVGALASFLMCTRSFAQPISQLSQQFNTILMALAGAERIFDLVDVPSESDDGYVTLVNAVKNENGTVTETKEHTGLWAWKYPHGDGTVTYTELKGDIVLDGVDFSYIPDKQILYDISLYAKPGQKIAFVGSTGAGKTTIINLLNRFYDIEDGKIRFDGININKIKKDDLRRCCGTVLQDTHLFTGTVKDNIRYGNPDISDEQVIKAAKIANADFFITHLANGYDTVLTADGANLSQGERQLLAIARAAAADPPVLILDEATSSIDTRTEALINKGMDELMKGRTVFVIAHRLSTVRSADAIMVLENGKIIERGNHDELINQKGRYYQLYTGLFELD